MLFCDSPGVGVLGTGGSLSPAVESPLAGSVSRAAGPGPSPLEGQPLSGAPGVRSGASALPWDAASAGTSMAGRLTWPPVHPQGTHALCPHCWRRGCPEALFQGEAHGKRKSMHLFPRYYE